MLLLLLSVVLQSSLLVQDKGEEIRPSSCEDWRCLNATEHLPCDVDRLSGLLVLLCCPVVFSGATLSTVTLASLVTLRPTSPSATRKHKV